MRYTLNRTLYLLVAVLMCGFLPLSLAAEDYEPISDRDKSKICQELINADDTKNKPPLWTITKTIANRCELFDVTDKSLTIEFTFQEHRKPSKPKYKKRLPRTPYFTRKGLIDCFFSADYTWKCRYQNARFFEATGYPDTDMAMWKTESRMETHLETVEDMLEELY